MVVGALSARFLSLVGCAENRREVESAKEEESRGRQHAGRNPTYRATIPGFQRKGISFVTVRKRV